MKLFLILAGLFVSLSQAAQLTVKWDDQSDNELGFAVERAPAPPSTEFVEIGRTAPDVVTYIDNTLASSTQYQYRVRAYGAKNYSEYSNIGLGTTNTVITPDDVALGPILPPGNIAVAPPPDPRPLHYVAPSIRFPSTMASIPARCDPYNNGTPNNDYGDYWSDSIQYLYYPDGTKSSKAGIAAGRTFAYYRGVFATAPLPDAYRSSDPDPATTVGAYVTKNGGRPLENAIAQARTSATTANDTVVLYRSGVIAIASTQTGMNAHGKVNIWPWYKLPPEKEPMDIAVSSNNELMLVAVYDNVLQKGQLAVFMCESKVLPFHTFHFAGLHGQPGFSDFILLGYVDLPIGKSLAEFPATLKLSVASGGAWESPTTTNNLSLGQLSDRLKAGIMKDAAGAWCVRDVLDPAYVTANSTRNLLYAGNWQAVLGKRGYAAVISREEDALCIVDLSSIFEYIRQSWMSSMESFKTTFAAREKGTWPETFEQRPDLIPRITVQKTLARPVSVLAGHQVGRWGTDRLKMHIGLEAGEVITLDASPIMAEYSWQKRGTVMGAQLSSVFVGKNPIHMCFGRTNDGSEVEELYPGTQTSDGLNNVVWVACRGDKKVVELLTHMAKSKVYRTIEDQRMNDPVAVHKNVRGPILNVADFAGKQIIGFRVGPLRNSRVTPAIDYPTAEGKAPIEITGFLKVPGNVYHINGDNVN